MLDFSRDIASKNEFIILSNILMKKHLQLKELFMKLLKKIEQSHLIELLNVNKIELNNIISIKIGICLPETFKICMKLTLFRA